MKKRYLVGLTALGLVSVISQDAFAYSGAYLGEDTTAYVEPSGSAGASGTVLSLGMVAVHNSSPGASPLDPILPFGTRIYTRTLVGPIAAGGNSYISSFTVQDTGDINWDPSKSLSAHWLDFYWGPTSTANNASALQWQRQPIDYDYTLPGNPMITKP